MRLNKNKPVTYEMTPSAAKAVNANLNNEFFTPVTGREEQEGIDAWEPLETSISTSYLPDVTSREGQSLINKWAGKAMIGTMASEQIEALPRDYSKRVKDRINATKLAGQVNNAQNAAGNFMFSEVLPMGLNIAGIGSFGSLVNAIGLLPAIETTATSIGGGYLGAKALGYAGRKIDETFDTNLEPWFTMGGSLLGGVAGGGLGYKGIVKAGSKGLLPKGNSTMYGDRFIESVIAKDLDNGMNPNSTFAKKRLQTLHDANTADRFIRENLWFKENVKETPIPGLGEMRSRIPLEQNPRTLIHWDGAVTGYNNPKNVPTIGLNIDNMKKIAHFENGNLVPAKTSISVRNGANFTSDTHPLMWSDHEPWYETGMNGRMFDRLVGETKQDWGYYFNRGKHYINTNYPNRFITIESNNPTIRFVEGAHSGKRTSHEYYSGPVPMSEINGFEWDPIMKTFSRVKYVNPK